MKKRIIIAISLALIAVISATSVVVARNDSPSDTPSRLENALNQQLEKAFENGLISQEVIDNIHNAWSGKSEEEQLQLYNRVCNMIQSKQKQARLENALNQQLEKALENGLISQEIVDNVHRAWFGKSVDEQLNLYNRVCQMIQSKQRQARLENAFFSTLDKAIELGYIDASRYDSISRLWAQSDSAKREQLYDRLRNMMESQGQTRGQ